MDSSNQGNLSSSSLQIKPPDVIMASELQQSMGSMPYMPQAQDEAWMKYIIEYNIGSEEKQEIINMLRPLMNLAPKSNIKRREIPMHLIGYELIWDKYFIFVKKGKYDPKLLVLEETLEEAFELQLNRSVEGWLGRLMHTRLFRIYQTSDEKSGVARGIGLFRRKKQQQGNMEE
jgi:hypothetical protein